MGQKMRSQCDCRDCKSAKRDGKALGGIKMARSNTIYSAYVPVRRLAKGRVRKDNSVAAREVFICDRV
jgi:hypothetical protein